MGNRSPVHPDVVVITKIQEPFLGELGVVVSADGVGDPEAGNNILDKTYCLLGANLGQGPCFDPLSELVTRDKYVGQAPGRFLKGAQKI
jgi:hypothetical protein